MKKPLRIWRSPFSHMGALLKVPENLQDETVTALDIYTDEQLSEIAINGFNGIWLYGLLQNMVSSRAFPEFAPDSKIHLRNIRKLIDRAAKHGIRVFILMQPPRAVVVESTFWNAHRKIGGQETDIISDDGWPIRMRSLCTSTLQVKEYLHRASADLAQALPELGGIILITASEYPSHCYGRTGKTTDETGGVRTISVDCPQCALRTPAEVISEIVLLIRNGIKSIAPKQEVIVWNWSWDNFYNPPYNEIIELLPRDVIIMADFERGGRKTILGKERIINEYSLSYSGPSDQFRKTCISAAGNKLRVIAKLQIATTHELATVPNLPLIGNLYDKAKALQDAGVTDVMGCWSFGNMTSANTAAFNFFSQKEIIGKKQAALCEFAAQYFPGCNTAMVCRAWKTFEEAMDYYPFALSFLYSGPLNYTLVYPMKPSPIATKPSGRSWLMDKRGDNLESSFGDYTIEEIIEGLGFLKEMWSKGVSYLQEGLKKTKNDHTSEELSNARACNHIFRSGWNTYRFYQLRRDWIESMLPEYLHIAEDELANLNAVVPVVEKDKRLGFHSEAQSYMYDSEGIKCKIGELKQQLRNIQY